MTHSEFEIPTKQLQGWRDMSVICCVYRRDGKPADLTVLDRMIEAGRPFGPDSEGKWISDHIGLGYGGFLTLSPSVGASQPPLNNDGTRTTILDGRTSDRHKSLHERLTSA